MSTLVLSQREVGSLLSIADCIDVMSDALSALANGEAVVPLRSVTMLPGQNAFAMMPAHLGSRQVVGAKVITFFNGNSATPYDCHQGAVLLFETQHGRLIAIMDATTITTVRTAAVTAVATRLLSRPNSGVLAILGAGVQARAHLEAMSLVRPIREVRVWSRSTERARSLVAYAGKEFGIEGRVSGTAAEAVRGADVVCTTTSATEPVLQGAWLSPGTHVNAIGASVPSGREIDTETVRRSRLYVDRRESALREPGDMLVPLGEGAITPDHIVGEIGEVLTGKAPGRRDAQEITLFKSLGLAVEDVAAAQFVHARALELGVGAQLELGGDRHGVD